MRKKAGNLEKTIKNVNFKIFGNFSILSLIVFTLLFSFVFCCFNSIYVIAGSSSFIPASPSGNTSTGINVENEYFVSTLEIGSSWMFDWGDGNYSNWIKVGSSDTYVSQTHSWDSYGEYEIRAKHRSIYNVESAWSSPLVVKVAPPADLDGDGWINELEVAYGKNPEDPNDYPLDTDNDGKPDEDSTDGKYTGDTDDDNDGVSDELEQKLGSNSKNPNDIHFIVVDGTVYCLVDNNRDGNSDILYNTGTELQTNVLIKDGMVYLDTDGDGKWDYTYSQGFITLYKEPFEIPWLSVILASIGIALIVISILFKKGILYLYQEEYVVEE